jgi:ABC-2 type transport system ATP-binding protein
MEASLSAAVETSALTKRYPRQRGLYEVVTGRTVDEVVALRDVNLTIHPGEVFGLLGPNGSGKTTFLKLLSTILSPSSGTARIFGHDIRQEPRRIRSLVALVTGEERSLYWRLTARQNLDFFARLYGRQGRSARAKVSELLDLFDLASVGDVRVAEYSTGMRQRLAIARGLLSEPRLLFLDEPTRGLDPVAAHNLLNRVRERAVEYFSNTVILTTHIMREVEQLCERIGLLNRGRLQYQGTVDELRTALDPHETYTLSVRGLSDEVLEALRSRSGVKECRPSLPGDGQVDLELVFARKAISLSDVLSHILSSRAEILKCTRREPSIEEIFRSIFGQGAERGSMERHG